MAHRFIHFKIIHRAYITPYKRFKMKLQSAYNCHICNTLSSGTFLHMFWECPIVVNLWTNVNLVLSSLLQIDYLSNPGLCLLNDDSDLFISSLQKRMLFSGFTAAKKTIIQNWFTPHMCAKTYWILLWEILISINLQYWFSFTFSKTLKWLFAGLYVVCQHMTNVCVCF